MNWKKLTAPAAGAVLAGLLTLPVWAGDLFFADVTASWAENPPVIDGVFDPEEGWGDPVLHRDSSDLKDCAETDPGYEKLTDDPALMITELDVYMKWDDTSFYYCANVTDPEHFNPEKDAAIWRGDSLIFHAVSVPNDDTRARILFGMDNDGKTWAFQETAEDGTSEVSGIDGWKITRDADTKVTTYEAVFKWEDIIPAKKLGAGEVFYLRDLFLLANAAHPEPFAAVVPEGYTDGKRNYSRITLSDGWVSSAFTSSFDAPPWLDAAGKVEFEDSYAEDETDCLMNEGAHYVYLKDLGKGDYSVEFEAEEDGVYDIGICLMAWQKSVPRATDVKVDDSARVRLEFEYGDEDKEREQFLTGFRVDLTKGVHRLTLSLPEGYDDTTLKTLYFDYFFWLLSDEAEAASVPAAEVLLCDGSEYADAADAAKALGTKPVTGYAFAEGSGVYFGGEGPDNLWDDDVTTKFCTDGFPAFSVVSTDGKYPVNGIIMATANDNASNPGRAPGDWNIYGSNDGAGWDLITHGDDRFFTAVSGDVDFTFFAAPIDPTPAYSYFKFECLSTAANLMQVSEIVLCSADAPEAAPEPEPEPAADPATEPEASADPAPADDPAAEETETDGSPDGIGEEAGPSANLNAGCRSFIGGGFIVLASVLGSALVSTRAARRR